MYNALAAVAESRLFWWLLMGVAVMISALLVAQGTWLGVIGTGLLLVACIQQLYRLSKKGRRTPEPSG